MRDKEKDALTALVVSIMLKTAERIGNAKSASDGHFGITMMEKRHFQVNGDSVQMNYIGKSGVAHSKSFTDELIARSLKKAIKNSPSKYVFMTSDGFQIRANRVNKYLDEFGISAKDIRGFLANKYAIDALNKLEVIEKDEKKRKKQFGKILKYVAKKVGHGTSTLRKHYLMPEVESRFIEKKKILDLSKFFKEGGKMELPKSALPKEPTVEVKKENEPSRRIVVGCFIYAQDTDEYLFLQRCTFSGDNRGKWHILSGCGNDGELPEDTARREIKEEVGYGGEYAHFEMIEMKSFPDYDFYYFAVTVPKKFKVKLDWENKDSVWVKNIRDFYNYDLIPEFEKYLDEMFPNEKKEDGGIIVEKFSKPMTLLENIVNLSF